MDSQNGTGAGVPNGSSIWPPVIFVFALLAVLFVFVFVIGKPSGPTAPAAAPAASQPATITAEHFAKALESRAPEYKTISMGDPIDGYALDVPDYANRGSNNFFGGVATDLMPIALAPPAGGSGRPDVELQNWEMLLVTNPETGATYHGKDILNYRTPGSYVLDEEWDLAAIAPPLAAKPVDEWTVDERIFMRILTMRAFGVERVELGFAALQGAYASNFGTWYGNEVRIPSAAFYALAAACLQTDLGPDTILNDTALTISAMTMGECYRLLGRADDAAAAFATVHATGLMEQEDTGLEASLEVLAQVEQLLAEGDYNLERAANSNFAPPPVGWYLAEMLPAINGHIAQHRGEWNEMDDVDEIIERIMNLIP